MVGRGLNHQAIGAVAHRMGGRLLNLGHSLGKVLGVIELIGVEVPVVHHLVHRLGDIHMGQIQHAIHGLQPLKALLTLGSKILQPQDDQKGQQKGEQTQGGEKSRAHGITSGKRSHFYHTPCGESIQEWGI